MNHILIIEDDKTLSSGIALALKSNDLAFHQAFSVHEARAVMDACEIHLFLLDINLPDGSGLDFLKELRGYSRKPVILLTANDTETDIVTGLELGAEIISIGEYLFDFEKMIFTKGGIPIELSKTGQKLLRILAVNRGRTIPRSELVDRVWNTFFL